MKVDTPCLVVAFFINRFLFWDVFDVFDLVLNVKGGKKFSGLQTLHVMSTSKNIADTCIYSQCTVHYF